MGSVREGQREASMNQVSPALGVVLLVAAGCATATIPFQTLREPAWGYTAEDGKIYIYENRPACRLRGLGACRQLVLDRGEFYWLVSLVEPEWVGSMQREACDAVRDYVRVELRQRTSDCTRVQLLLLE